MSGGADDYIYENAPLVEVIAEVRWMLLPIASMPGVEIDPIYDRGHPRVQEVLAKLGFKHVERLVPEQVPQEMVAGQPVFRYRPGPSRWPLVQLGPGVMTVNVTPPYEGWSEFSETLEQAILAIDGVFHFGEQFSLIKSVELRYLDAFTSRHGLSDYVEFIREDLSIFIQPPVAVVEELKEPEGALMPSVSLQFPVRGQKNDRMMLSASPGARDGEPALIYDLRVLHDTPEGAIERSADVITWMDGAHRLLNLAFERSISDRLREAIGPRRGVREQR